MDYETGLQKAIEQAVRAELSKYENIERKLTEEELLVVQALASMPDCESALNFDPV